MFKSSVAGLLAYVLAGAITGASAMAQDCSGTITAEEVLAAEDARYAAQTTNDFATMAKLYGDDLV